jgi:hypothetical protein
MACGGIPLGIMMGSVYVMNFSFNAVPGIEEYCQDHYREKWDEYCKKVPWKLVPYIY